MSTKICVNANNINWRKLDLYKWGLLKIIRYFRSSHPDSSENIIECLDGIVDFVNTIQERAVKRLGVDVVYGRTQEDDNDIDNSG